MDEIAIHILGHKDDKRVPKLIKSIQYYLDGAKDNVVKNKSKVLEKNKSTHDKNDVFGPIVEINDFKKLGSENLNTQVIFSLKKN